ncbi:MAG: YcaQ family DNA glycosylase, partial [Acidimicrobiales bacterium]|nr:YcaQ family DNA glycosylase [Acidimicrobiales bacterium]
MGQEKLSASEARWLALSAQALSKDPPLGPATRAHLRRAIRAVGVVQLDAINVVERTQRLVLFSRIGAYDPALLDAMSGPGGDLFETPGFRAALMPMAQQPLLRWRTASYGVPRDNPTYVKRVDAYYRANAGYISAVLAEVAERGPLAASELSDPRRRRGEWWQRRSDGRRALEILFARGDLAAWRTARFERAYDLPERVIPASVLTSPTPSPEEAQRALIRLAAASLGVATVADLARYHLLDPMTVKARVAELVEAGELVPVQVEGWRAPAVMTSAARPSRPKRTRATLLSPFDSLIWDRERTRRVFGFDYRIEVYLPEVKRRHGYYVL